MSWGNITAHCADEKDEDDMSTDTTEAARLDLRAALRRIVAEHPELTSEAARERAAAWVGQEQDEAEVNRVEHP